MAQVTGIGGFFFRADDPEKLARWYEEYLGISTSALFWQAAGATVWAPYSRKSEYFGPADRQWMVNLRVDDINGFVERLRAMKVAVGEITEHATGRFARLTDGEGNPLELWEPVPDHDLKAIESAA